MRASDGMHELDGLTFGVKPTEGLQPKGFESVLHWIPGFTEISAYFVRQILIALMKVTHKALLKNGLLMKYQFLHFVDVRLLHGFSYLLFV